MIAMVIAFFSLHSPAFESQGIIPQEYGCSGKGMSPELVWENPPEGTEYFTLIVQDETNDLVLWKLRQIPSELRRIPRGGALPKGVLEEIHYKPFCPPFGEKHHYVFALYAMKGEDKSLEGEIVGKAEMKAFFQQEPHKTAPNPPFKNPNRKENPDALESASYPLQEEEEEG